MPKAPPQFNFYYNDWLGGVTMMSHTEENCYLHLLIRQWQDGYIPLTKSSRMKVCSISDQGQWDGIWETLRHKFEPFDLDDTTIAFRNPRMEEDREYAISVWAQRRSAALKATKAASIVRAAERTPVRDPVSDKDKDTTKTLGNDTLYPDSPDKLSTNTGKVKSREEFESFWLAYPPRNGRRRGKEKAYGYWKALPVESRSGVLRAAQAYAKETDTEYVADCFRWLRDATWEAYVGDKEISKSSQIISTKPPEELFQ